MNIELGIGIGGSSLASPTSNDQLVAYAWAMAGVPNVTTSTVINKNVISVIANSITSALVPSISNAGNAVISAVIVNAITSAPVPIVAIAGSISISAVVASSNSDSITPVVSAIRNISVVGVVANSTASAGVLTVSVGGGSSYYLKMDGVDDYLKLPSMTLNKIVADVKIRRRTDFVRILWDFRSGIGFTYLQQQTNGTDSLSNGTVKVNGTLVSNGTVFIPNDMRVTIEQTFGASGTDDGNVFSNNSGSTNSVIDGDIFDIKIYNGETLVSWYDMTLGTVQDQTGNGNHATLTGGTWVVA